MNPQGATSDINYATTGSGDLLGEGRIVTRPKALQVAGSKGAGRHLGSFWQFM